MGFVQGGRRILVDGALVDDLPAEIGHEYALGAIVHDRTQRKEGAT